MKKCPKCGTILDDSKKKCYMCGTQLTASVSSFGDTFNTQIGSEVSSSSESFLNNNSDFSFNNNFGGEVSNFGESEDNFFGSDMSSLNSMAYDERSDLKKGFDSVFKNEDSFKSKEDEARRLEEEAQKKKAQEEELLRKKQEKERLAKEKQLKKERDRQRALQEKQERERQKAERAEALKKEKEEKARILAEEKAKQEEILRQQKEEQAALEAQRKAEEARVQEEKRIEAERLEEQRRLEQARVQEEKRLESERLVAEKKAADERRKAENVRRQQEKVEAEEKARLERQRQEEEKNLKKQFEEQERIRKQKEQAEAMRIERDNAYLRKIEAQQRRNDVSAVVSNKPDINWGNGLVDNSIEGYEDKVSKANKKFNFAGVFNFICVVIFIALMGYVYVNFLKPEGNEDINLGGLIYTVDEDFKLSNNDGATKYYTYGESCGLRITYGATNDSNGFVENYLEEVKTQYESDMNSFTEKSSVKINGNVWSELSVMYLEEGQADSTPQNILKYKYVSIVYKGNFYHTVFVNPNNDKKCYNMYEDFIQTMKFE